MRNQTNTTSSIKEKKSYLKLYDKLFLADSIETFLSVLYKETHRRFKIRSLIFYWPEESFGPLHYVCSTKQVYKNFSISAYPFPSSSLDSCSSLHFKVKNKEDSRYIAESLGRPVGDILNIAIQKDNTNEINPSTPLLFVEFCAKNPDPLIEFYNSIFDLLSQSLNRLLKQEQTSTDMKLWVSIFEGIPEPLAIFDEEQHLIKANHSFNEIFGSADTNTLAQRTFEWKNRIFKKYFYPIKTNGSEHTIYHYVDITESLVLRNQMVQDITLSALGELGEAVAHQLSNPLAGVLSMSQLILKSEGLNPEVKKDMQDITEAVSRSQEIISNLLDFSRADSKLEVYNLNEVVQKTVPFLKSLISFSNFQLELSEKPVFIKAQACLLQQVVFNLVKNACQAVGELKNSDHRQVKIQVFQKKHQALLQVEDSGQGVPTKDYENIFKPFFTTKSVREGTGLGLNMSRDIIESFKGNLTVGRSPLGGASFTMALPVSISPSIKIAGNLKSKLNKKVLPIDQVL